MKAPKFSFVICTKNCASTIIRVLDSIRLQEDYNFVQEILLVFFNTTDETIIIASDYAKKFDLPLKLVECKKPGKTPALMLGLKKAIGDFCVIVDDDNFLFADYITNAVTLVKNKKFACFGARGHLDPELTKPDWFSEYEGHFAIGMPKGNTDWVWGACALVNLEAWRSLVDLEYKMWINIERSDNAAPILIGGEDTEFSLAFGLLGYEVKFSEKLNFIHSFNQRRLQKEYFLANTLGCFRAAAVTEMYRIVLYDKFFPSPMIRLYYVLLRSILSNSIRSILAFSVRKKFKSDYHRSIVLGVASGFMLFRKDLQKIVSDLRRIKAANG